MNEQPENEYGEWTRGNTGQVGRTVTSYHQSTPGTWIPMVSWEPHPDEAGTFGHKNDCRCTSCSLMAETREASS